MKSTLEFDLPEERDELNDALNGGKYKARIDTLYDEVFRPHMKYNKPVLAKDESSMQELTDEQLEIIEQIWENVFKHFEDVLE
jgi:hypothetical protein